jgi:hypothetical protein
LDAAVVEEDSTELHTSFQNGTFIITSPHLRMNDMPTSNDEFEESRSVAVQNYGSQLNSKDKQRLKEPQSKVIQENNRLMVTVDPDESTSDSSAEWPDPDSYAMPSNTAEVTFSSNDTDTTKSVTEACIIVCTGTYNLSKKQNI